MRVFYATEPFNQPVPVESGGLLITFDADETDIQEGIIRMLMLNAQSMEARAAFADVLKYVTVTPQSMSS